MEIKSIFLELKKLTNIIKRQIDNSLDNKVTHTQIFILCYIKNKNDQGFKIYSKDIEKFLQNRRSTVWEILNTMEKSSLIKRVGANDLKLREIVLTKMGLECVLKFQNKLLKMENDMFKGISDLELKNFYFVIEKIERNLEDDKVI